AMKQVKDRTDKNKITESPDVRFVEQNGLDISFETQLHDRRSSVAEVPKKPKKKQTAANEPEALISKELLVIVDGDESAKRKAKAKKRSYHDEADEADNDDVYISDDDLSL